VRLLQLVDGALPKLSESHPLMLAIAQRKEQLVRLYMQLDVVDHLSVREKADCVTAAIEGRALGVLTQLLERINPGHWHVISAIHSGVPEILDAVLEAGGPAILHPRLSGRPSCSRRGRSTLRAARGGRTAARGGGLSARVAAQSGGLADGAAAGNEKQPQHIGRPPPRLTPLALACSLGHVALVEVLCQWARRERVHLDPSAPLVLSADGGSAPASARGRAGGTAGTATTSPWWDQEDLQRQAEGVVPSFGDPPMVMAVRGTAPSAVKARMIAVLHQYGFAADARSPLDSWTPLLAAVSLGSSELIAVLTKIGARMSADRHLGLTPLHLACQMGHWHLVPVLAEAMRGQYDRVAAWGPSPQYVSLNLVDVYGRTPLDIALLHYFNDPLPMTGEAGGRGSGCGVERQKAVDVLREFVHRKPSREASLMCGWELLRVMRFLEGLPNKKVAGPQLWPGDYCEGGGASPLTRAHEKRGRLPDDDDGSVDTGRWSEGEDPHACGDMEAVLQAIRTLVQLGARTQKLPADLVQPPGAVQPLGTVAGAAAAVGSGAADSHAPAGSSIKEALVNLSMKCRPEQEPRYSPLEPDDIVESSLDAAAL